MKFSPCRGGEHCTEDGTHCQGCGRSHEEIAATRALVASLVDFAGKMQYENVEEFAHFIADKAVKKVQSEKSPGIGVSIPLGR